MTRSLFKRREGRHAPARVLKKTVVEKKEDVGRGGGHKKEGGSVLGR